MPRHIFLLMGQSNMAGFGCVNPADPWQPGDRDPVDGVFMLTGQGTVRSAGWWRPVRWRPAAHPLHRHQNSSRLGLAIEFARRYRDVRPGVEVGLIPCAWGGAEIARLHRGSPIYRNAMRRCAIARRAGEIRAVLWQQGESDSDTPAHTAAYESKLRRMIADLRADLGQPELAWIIGDLSHFFQDFVRPDDPPRAERISTIRSILRQVAASDPRTAFVESTGLQSPPGDIVHFNRDSYLTFGRRYAESLLALESSLD